MKSVGRSILPLDEELAGLHACMMSEASMHAVATMLSLSSFRGADAALRAAEKAEWRRCVCVERDAVEAMRCHHATGAWIFEARCT